jgi:electron transport complex protein RnfG
MSRPAPVTDQNSIARESGPAMLTTLALVAGLSGLLVVLTDQITRPMIAQNQRLAIDRALFRVLPGAVSRRDFRVDGQRLVSLDTMNTEGGDRLYAAYDQQGQLAGVAVEAAIQGYQDLIRVLYGYDPACQCIRGMEVLKMAETPGIGDKIARDPDFRKNFIQLDARLNGAGTDLVEQIVTVPHGSKTNLWEIDAISGATISSAAVGRMLNDSARHMLPLILQHLEQLRKPVGGQP